MAHKTIQNSEEITRSALILKMLTFHKTGAIIAVVTVSLPETIGEERNWDYRCCWIRDSSMIIKVLFQLKHYDIAKRFLQFILDVIPDKDKKYKLCMVLEEKKYSIIAGKKKYALEFPVFIEKF